MHVRVKTGVIRDSTGKAFLGLLYIRLAHADSTSDSKLTHSDSNAEAEQEGSAKEKYLAAAVLDVEQQALLFDEASPAFQVASLSSS